MEHPSGLEHGQTTQHTVTAPDSSGAPVNAPARPDQGIAGIMEALASLARSLERIRAAQARAAGLRLPAYALLGLVAASGERGTTVSEAALKLGVRPQGLSGAVAELARAGFLQRDVDQTDARARRLRITDQGRACLGQNAAISQRLVEEVLSQVPHPSVAKLVLSRLDLALRRALQEA
jgi:DNA-binding MarR family transcriptional regulator